MQFADALRAAQEAPSSSFMAPRYKATEVAERMSHIMRLSSARISTPPVQVPRGTNHGSPQLSGVMPSTWESNRSLDRGQWEVSEIILRDEGGVLSLLGESQCILERTFGAIGQGLLPVDSQCERFTYGLGMARAAGWSGLVKSVSNPKHSEWWFNWQDKMRGTAMTAVAEANKWLGGGRRDTVGGGSDSDEHDAHFARGFGEGRPSWAGAAGVGDSKQGAPPRRRKSRKGSLLGSGGGAVVGPLAMLLPEKAYSLVPAWQEYTTAHGPSPIPSTAAVYNTFATDYPTDLAELLFPAGPHALEIVFRWTWNSSFNRALAAWCVGGCHAEGVFSPSLSPVHCLFSVPRPEIASLPRGRCTCSWGVPELALRPGYTNPLDASSGSDTTGAQRSAMAVTQRMLPAVPAAGVLMWHNGVSMPHVSPTASPAADGGDASTEYNLDCSDSASSMISVSSVGGGGSSSLSSPPPLPSLAPRSASQSRLGGGALSGLGTLAEEEDSSGSGELESGNSSSGSIDGPTADSLNLDPSMRPAKWQSEQDEEDEDIVPSDAFPLGPVPTDNASVQLDPPSLGTLTRWMVLWAGAMFVVACLLFSIEQLPTDYNTIPPDLFISHQELDAAQANAGNSTSSTVARAVYGALTKEQVNEARTVFLRQPEQIRVLVSSCIMMFVAVTSLDAPLVLSAMAYSHPRLPLRLLLRAHVWKAAFSTCILVLFPWFIRQHESLEMALPMMTSPLFYVLPFLLPMLGTCLTVWLYLFNPWCSTRSVGSMSCWLQVYHCVRGRAAFHQGLQCDSAPCVLCSAGCFARGEDPGAVCCCGSCLGCPSNTVPEHKRRASIMVAMRSHSSVPPSVSCCTRVCSVLTCARRQESLLSDDQRRSVRVQSFSAAKSSARPVKRIGTGGRDVLHSKSSSIEMTPMPLPTVVSAGSESPANMPTGPTARASAAATAGPVKRTMLSRASIAAQPSSHVNPLISARVAAAGGGASAEQRNKRLSLFVSPKRNSQDRTHRSSAVPSSVLHVGGGSRSHTPPHARPSHADGPQTTSPQPQRQSVSFAVSAEAGGTASDDTDESSTRSGASGRRPSRRPSAVPGIAGPRDTRAMRLQFARGTAAPGSSSGTGEGTHPEHSGALGSAREAIRSTGNMLLQHSKRFILGRTAEEEATLLEKRNKDDAAVFRAVSTRRLHLGSGAREVTSSRARSGTLALRFVESVTAVKGVLTDFALHALNAMATHERLTARRVAVSVLLLLGIGSSAVFSIYLPQMALRNGEHFGLQAGFMTAYAACQLLVFHLVVTVLPFYASTGLPGPSSSTPARIIGWTCAVAVRFAALLCCAAWRSQREEGGEGGHRNTRAVSSASAASTSTVAPAIQVTSEQEFSRWCCGGLCFGCAAVRAPMGHRKRGAGGSKSCTPCWLFTPQSTFDSSGRLHQMSSLVPDPWFNMAVAPLAGFALHCLNTMGFLSTTPYIPSNSFLAGLLVVHFVPFVFIHLAWLHVSWRDLFIYGQSWFGLVLSAEDDSFMLDPTARGRDVCSAMGPCLRRTALRCAMAPRMGNLELHTVTADVMAEVDTDAAGAINSWAQQQGAAATAAAQRAQSDVKSNSTTAAYISAGLGALVPPPAVAKPVKRAACFCCGCCRCCACVARKCGKEVFVSDQDRVEAHHEALVHSCSELPIVSSLWRAAVKGSVAGGRMAAAHCVAMVTAGEESALDFSEFAPDVHQLDTGIGGGVPAMSLRSRNRVSTASTASTVSPDLFPRNSSFTAPAAAQAETMPSPAMGGRGQLSTRCSMDTGAAALGAGMHHFKAPTVRASKTAGGRRSIKGGVAAVLKRRSIADQVVPVEVQGLSKNGVRAGDITPPPVGTAEESLPSLADSKSLPNRSSNSAKIDVPDVVQNPMRALVAKGSASSATSASPVLAVPSVPAAAAAAGSSTATTDGADEDETVSSVDKNSDPTKRFRGMGQYSAAGARAGRGRGRLRRASLAEPGGVSSLEGGGGSQPRSRRASSVSLLDTLRRSTAAEVPPFELSLANQPNGKNRLPDLPAATTAATATATAAATSSKQHSQVNPLQGSLQDLPLGSPGDLPAQPGAGKGDVGGVQGMFTSGNGGTRNSTHHAMQPVLSRARAGTSGASSPRRGRNTPGTQSSAAVQGGDDADLLASVSGLGNLQETSTENSGGTVRSNPLQAMKGVRGGSRRASVVQRAASARLTAQSPGTSAPDTPSPRTDRGGATHAMVHLKSLPPPPARPQYGQKGQAGDRARPVMRRPGVSAHRKRGSGGATPPPPPSRSTQPSMGRSGRAVSVSQAQKKHGRAPPLAPFRGVATSVNARDAMSAQDSHFGKDTPTEKSDSVASVFADFKRNSIPSSPEELAAELRRAKAAMAAMQVKLGVLARAAGLNPLSVTVQGGSGAGGDSVTRPRRGRGNGDGRADPLLTAQLAAKAEQLLNEHRKRGLDAAERASVYGEAGGDGRTSRASLSSIATPRSSSGSSNSRGRSGSAARRRTAMISYVQRGGGQRSEEQLREQEEKAALAEFEASLLPSMLEPVVIRVAPPPDAFSSLTAGLAVCGIEKGGVSGGGVASAVKVNFATHSAAGGWSDPRREAQLEAARRQAALQACIDTHGQYLHFNRFLSSLPPAQRLPLLLQGWALAQAQGTLLALLASTLTCIMFLATFGLAVVGQNKHVFSFRNASVLEVTNAFWYCAITLGISVIVAIAFIPRMHVQYSIRAAGQVSALLAPRPMLALSWGFLFTVAVHWLTQRSTSAVMPFGEYGAEDM